MIAGNSSDGVEVHGLCLDWLDFFFFFFFFFFIIPAGLSSTCYTTTEAPVIAHHAKLGGLRLAPKGPALHGGAPPIKEKKGRGVNWFTYRVAFVRAQTHLHYLQSRSLERGGGH